jgi:hypothetical protein
MVYISGIRVFLKAIMILVVGLVIVTATGFAAGHQITGQGDHGGFENLSQENTAIPLVKTAEFRVYDNVEINVANDMIPAGNYSARRWGGFSIINTPDASKTVLGKIRICLKGDAFTAPSYKDYAVWDRTSICWKFPKDFVVNETLDWKTNATFAANYHTTAQTPVTNPVMLKRSVNRSLFASEGVQFNSYEVRFTKNEFEKYSGRAAYEEMKYSNSSMIFDSFKTDLPLLYLTNRSYFDPVDKRYISEINIEVNKSAVQLNRTYHYSFSALIKPKNNAGLPVKNYPRIFFALDKTGPLYAGTNGTTAVMPKSLLPSHVSFANATTNVSNTWQYRHNTQIKLAFNQSAVLVRPDRTGVFRPSDHTFYLKNNSGTYPVIFGAATEVPVTGDWNGDGTWDIGVFNPANRTFLLQTGTAAKGIIFGQVPDLPVAGDWDGDGIWEVGVFNRSTHQFLLKNEPPVSFGSEPDIPISGDWNGDGIWDVGVFNKSTHRFLLKNGTGTTTVNFGLATDLPVSGDWNADTLYEIGVYRPSNQTFYLKTGLKITQIKFGLPGDKPITGKW